MRRKTARTVLVVAVLIFCAAVLCRAGFLPRYGDGNPVQALGQGLLTSQEKWYGVRAVSAADSALTGKTKAWHVIRLSLVRMPPWNTTTLSFVCYGDGTGGGDPNAGSFSYEVYVCRMFGSLEKVCGGTATVGELEASVLPHDDHGTPVADPNQYKWVEGGASLVTSAAWDTNVGATQVADEMGKISFDPLGTPYLYVRVYDITNITTVYVLVTGR
jgi:hypothetical protein